MNTARPPACSPVMQVDKSAAPMRCVVDRDTGELKTETRFRHGILTDSRHLLKRTQYRQRVTFTPTRDDSEPVTASSSASGASVGHPVTLNRVFNRVETVEEAAAAEEAEEAARIMLAHQAATLSLLSAGGAIDIDAMIGRAKTTAAAAAATADAAAGTPATPTKAAAGGSGTGAAAGGGGAAFAPGVTPCVSFTGRWVLEKAKSDTLDGMLTLMGVPWFARKIANSIEITAVLKHDVTGGVLVTEDHSSMGIQPNTYPLDGKTRPVTAKDGKTSMVTATVVPLPGPVDPKRGCTATDCDPILQGAFSAMRLHTVLPDGAGETTDTRVMAEGGRVMKQRVVYVKVSVGGHAAARGDCVLLLHQVHHLPSALSPACLPASTLHCRAARVLTRGRARP